nr:LOW QUALITY PROTEIN: CXXC-type zinc finger protein 1 [Loxodonta africana]
MEGDGSDPEPPDAGEDSKSENGENAPIYCICRKPDINCFMIGCDNCNEWFHGDCIRITEKMAKAIREWYCRECREKDPKLEIRYRHKKSRERDGSERDSSEPRDEGGGRKRLPRIQTCTEESPFLDPALRKRAVKVKHVKRREKKSEKKKEERYKRHRQKQKHKDKWKHPERTDAKDPASLPQCLGPGCVRPAQPGSKYCSDDCGMKLAANRIYEILPQRIQQWQQSPCIAEEHGKKLLERIRREQQSARTRLQEMERRFHELEAIILRAKQQAVREDEESNEGDSDDTDLQIFCVSCGHPINPRVALRHMERCYAKYESQTSFGSMYPTRIEGATRLFCDVYNPQSKTYCKRLQVLCPEHSRDPKVPADEVCGCPLVRDVFELTGDFCRLPKRQCNRHYCWEKLRRAEVDLERVRVWYKLDELFEQERNVRTAMTNRAGLLALMLHQTIQHDPLTTDLRSSADR